MCAGMEREKTRKVPPPEFQLVGKKSLFSTHASCGSVRHDQAVPILFNIHYQSLCFKTVGCTPTLNNSNGVASPTKPTNSLDCDGKSSRSRRAWNFN